MLTKYMVYFYMCYIPVWRNIGILCTRYTVYIILVCEYIYIYLMYAVYVFFTNIYGIWLHTSVSGRRFLPYYYLFHAKALLLLQQKTTEEKRWKIPEIQDVISRASCMSRSPSFLSAAAGIARKSLASYLLFLEATKYLVGLSFFYLFQGAEEG